MNRYKGEGHMGTIINKSKVSILNKYPQTLRASTASPSKATEVTGQVPMCVFPFHDAEVL